MVVREECVYVCMNMCMNLITGIDYHSSCGTNTNDRLQL